jgi:hypothetical protein
MYNIQLSKAVWAALHFKTPSDNQLRQIYQNHGDAMIPFPDIQTQSNQNAGLV